MRKAHHRLSRIVASHSQRRVHTSSDVAKLPPGYEPSDFSLSSKNSTAPSEPPSRVSTCSLSTYDSSAPSAYGRPAFLPMPALNERAIACDLAHLTTCGETFRIDERDRWCSHAQWHLGGHFPARTSCPFGCGRAFDAAVYGGSPSLGFPRQHAAYLGAPGHQRADGEQRPVRRFFC